MSYEHSDHRGEQCGEGDPYQGLTIAAKCVPNGAQTCDLPTPMKMRKEWRHMTRRVSPLKLPAGAFAIRSLSDSLTGRNSSCRVENLHLCHVTTAHRAGRRNGIRGQFTQHIGESPIALQNGWFFNPAVGSGFSPATFGSFSNAHDSDRTPVIDGSLTLAENERKTLPRLCRWPWILTIPGHGALRLSDGTPNPGRPMCCLHRRRNAADHRGVGARSRQIDGPQRYSPATSCEG